jgi:hypothetical protein
MLNRFLVVKCFNCGRIQGMEARSSTKSMFKCKYCQKSRKLKSTKNYGLAVKVLWQGNNAKEAGDVCRTYTNELQNQEAEKIEERKIKNRLG